MKHLRIFSTLVVLLFASFHLSAQKIEVYPANWWVGMKEPRLQLMLHGDKIAGNNFAISYPGVRLVKVNKVENKNYVFLDLLISPTAKLLAQKPTCAR